MKRVRVYKRHGWWCWSCPTCATDVDGWRLTLPQTYKIAAEHYGDHYGVIRIPLL
jgi:hypothetical protein